MTGGHTMPTIYRTDQVGSLVRPAKLLDARDEYKAGKISLEDLRKVEDESILEALRMQREVGIDIYTDGEMRRDSWQTGIVEAVEGFQEEYPVMESTRPDGTVVKLEMHHKATVGKLRQVRRLTGVDAAFLQQHAPGPFKITMASPSYWTNTSYTAGVTDKIYPSKADLRRDILGIVKGEVRALVDDGAAYIQFDEGFTLFTREAWR